MQGISRIISLRFTKYFAFKLNGPFTTQIYRIFPKLVTHRNLFWLFWHSKLGSNCFRLLDLNQTQINFDLVFHINEKKKVKKRRCVFRNYNAVESFENCTGDNTNLDAYVGRSSASVVVVKIRTTWLNVLLDYASEMTY